MPSVCSTVSASARDAFAGLAERCSSPERITRPPPTGRPTSRNWGCGELERQRGARGERHEHRSSRLRCTQHARKHAPSGWSAAPINFPRAAWILATPRRRHASGAAAGRREASGRAEADALQQSRRARLVRRAGRARDRRRGPDGGGCAHPAEGVPQRTELPRAPSACPELHRPGWWADERKSHTRHTSQSVSCVLNLLEL